MYYCNNCARAIITGIVKIDNTLTKDVTFDASAVSRSYFAANITVLLAVGADALKTQATSKVPPKPKSLSPNIVIKGIAIILSPTVPKFFYLKKLNWKQRYGYGGKWENVPEGYYVLPIPESETMF